MSTITFTSTPIEEFEVDGRKYLLCMFGTSHWHLVTMQALLLHDPNYPQYRLEEDKLDLRVKQEVEIDVSNNESYLSTGISGMGIHWSRIEEIKRLIPKEATQISIGDNYYTLIRDSFSGVKEKATWIVHDSFYNSPNLSSLEEVENLFLFHPLRKYADIYEHIRRKKRRKCGDHKVLFSTLNNNSFEYTWSTKLCNQIPEALASYFKLPRVRRTRSSNIRVVDGELVANHVVIFSQRESESKSVRVRLEYSTVAGENPDPNVVLSNPDKIYFFSVYGLRNDLAVTTEETSES